MYRGVYAFSLLFPWIPPVKCVIGQCKKLSTLLASAYNQTITRKEGSGSVVMRALASH